MLRIQIDTKSVELLVQPLSCPSLQAIRQEVFHYAHFRCCTVIKYSIVTFPFFAIDKAFFTQCVRVLVRKVFIERHLGRRYE